MFGSMNQHLNASYFFNSHVTTGYKNSEHKEDGMTVLTDISASMQHRVSELKVVWSAFTAITNTKDQNILPTLGGSTALADAAAKIAKGLGPNEKLLIITDGDDTASVKWKCDVHDQEEKRSAVVKYIEETCAAEIFLIGMGNEVKDFVKAAANPGHRTRVAHIPDGATAAQITGVVRATVNAPPREVGANATVIEIDAPEAQALQPNEEQVKQIQAIAADVAVGGGMTVATFKGIVESVEASLNVGTVDKHKARTAIMYFINQIIESNMPLAGALLGGKVQHIFVDPSYPEQSGWHSYLNQMLSRLQKKVLCMHPKLTEPVAYNMEGHVFTYNKVNTYSLLDSVSPQVVRAVVADTAWCPPQSELTMISHGKGQKRKAEEDAA